MRFRIAARAGVLLILTSISRLPSANASPWLEAESPHFTVATNTGKAQALALAMRFERVWAVFQKAFPGMRVFPRLPIIILAVDKGPMYTSLEPAAWLKKGTAGRSGMLYRGPDKNYILILLNAPGQQPYRIIFHEFSHLILEDNYRSIPLWLNEGLAQFYSDMEFKGSTVRMGLPSQMALSLLRSSSMIPLPTLFKVNPSSPYYNQASLGNLFYAESWALTDYLMFLKGPSGRGPIDNYLHRTDQGENAITAAAKTFGNLHVLQRSLQDFVRRKHFRYYRLKVRAHLDPRAVKIQTLSPLASATLRGDFLVRVGRFHEAKMLLARALAANPSPPEADESMGLLELRKGDVSRASTWFALAVRRCSQCYLARFYQALVVMHGHPSPARSSEIRSDLRAFIQFNPTYAPAWAALAEFEARQRGRLQAALQFSVKAAQLDPQNVSFLLLEGSILLKMRDFTSAGRVAQAALQAAQTPRAKALAYVFLGMLQEAESAGHE